ncbi:MAG: hypothetical protein ABH846_00165 [Patescibacteria group bacterium]
MTGQRSFVSGGFMQTRRGFFGSIFGGLAGFFSVRLLGGCAEGNVRAATALDILVADGYRIKYGAREIDGELRAFITEVNGQPDDPAHNRYWIILVDGEVINDPPHRHIVNYCCDSIEPVLDYVYE